MNWGMPWSAAWGDPSQALAYCVPTISADGTRLIVRFRPRAGLGNSWFLVYAFGRKLAHVLARESAETLVEAPVPYGSTEIAVHVLHAGGCADPLFDVSHVVRGRESIDCRRVTLQWAWAPAVIPPDSENDGGYTSAWSLAGVAYARNVETDPPHVTRGRLRLILSVAAGTATVALQRHGVTVASGSAAVASLPATVALAEQNGSGLSGSLTLAAAVADTTGWLYVRWPAFMRVLRDTGSPPTTTRATVPFDGRSAMRWTEPSNVAAGTHYYRLVPISDTDDVGTASAILEVIIPSPPAPPTSLAYASGSAAATVLSFVKSTTAGATYRAYLQHIDGDAMDFDTPAATAPADSVSITLPAITGYPGTARVVLRAVSPGGVEEQNNTVLSIEYDAAGARVALRPNAASLDEASLEVDDGLTLSIDALYDAMGEAAVATTVKLFTRAPGAAYNYASPDATGTLASAGMGLKKKALSVTFGAAGWYYLRVVAYTSAGTPSEYSDCPEIPVYVSDADVDAPTNVQAAVARG